MAVRDTIELQPKVIKSILYEYKYEICETPKQVDYIIQKYASKYYEIDKFAVGSHYFHIIFKRQIN